MSGVPVVYKYGNSTRLAALPQYPKNSNNWTLSQAVKIRCALRSDLLVSVNMGFIISWQLIMQCFLPCCLYLYSN